MLNQRASLLAKKKNILRKTDLSIDREGERGIEREKEREREREEC